MARQYQIRLKGSLDASWSAWFDGLTITHDGAGDTLLEGAVRDQTALYGLLDKARDLGLSLIAVEQRAPATESDPLVSTVTHVIPGRTGGSDEETIARRQLLNVSSDAPLQGTSLPLGVHTMYRMIEMMRPGRARTSDRTSTEANRKLSRGTRTWRWWAGRTLLGLLLLVMVLAAITLGAGARAKAVLRMSHPPIGQMVDVGGYKLHIACEGVGSPTVVLDAGAGDLGLTWAQVQPSVAKSTRVCTYDRAGLGWSEQSPRPRTAEVMVDELHTLLANAGIAGPYVLVGHSLGGVVVRQYAHTYPAGVAGIVLVDSAHEAQWLRFPQAVRDNLPSVLRQLRLVQAAASIGIGALKPSLMPLESRLPLEVAETARALKISGNDVGTGAAELANLAGGRTPPLATLGDIPLIVLSHSHRDPETVPPSAAITPQVLQEYDQTQEQLQLELTALSTNGKRIVAAGSGHYVQLDRPDLVIRALEELLAVARR